MIQIPSRNLGALKVPVIGLGCMGMSAFYISPDQAQLKEAEYVQLIRDAVDRGVNFFDTAEVYGPHTNELLLGKAIATLDRSKLIIATKFGIYIHADGTRTLDSSPLRVRQAVEASLKRLGTSYIDLYYQHRPDPNTPIEDTMRELKKLAEEGKIKYIGLSETSAENVKRAHAIHPISALQYEWSIWSRELEKEIVPVANELGIGIVAYSPLGRGFLSGTVKKLEDLDAADWRRRNPRFTEEAMKENEKIAKAVNSVALRRNCTPAQVCIAWVLAKGENVVVIPGTTSLKRLEENIASLNVVLQEEDFKDLQGFDALVKGARY